MAVGVERALVELGGDGFGDDAELLARGGPVDVDGDEHGAMASLFEPCGELGRGGGLAAALQAGHQHDAGRLRAGAEARGVLAKEGDEFVVDDFDDLFGGREGGGDLRAERAESDVLDQVGDDGEADVGLDEGDADFAEGFGDVLVGDGALAAQGLEGTLEFVAERFKHAALSLAGTSCRSRRFA